MFDSNRHGPARYADSHLAREVQRSLFRPTDICTDCVEAHRAHHNAVTKILSQY
jgi:hypothetical protein